MNSPFRPMGPGSFPSPAEGQSPPAGGQTQRIAGASREARLHDQLYRYADDLRDMMESQTAFQAKYDVLRESFERIAESRQMLSTLVQQSQDMHIVTDARGVIRSCNPASERIAPSVDFLGSSLEAWVTPAAREKFVQLHATALSGSGAPNLARDAEELVFRRDNPNLPMLIGTAQVFPLRLDNENTLLHWNIRDVTAIRKTEFENKISAMVFRHAIEGVMITDADGKIIAVNPAFSRITGYEASEVLGRKPSILKSGVQDESFYVRLWGDLADTGFWQGEIYNRRRSGEIYPEWLTISSVRDAAGQAMSYIAVFSDLSRVLEAEKRLAHLASHDFLTGLPNRMLFNDRLAQCIEQSRRSDQPFTLLYLDLDRFKHINDTYGHRVGDIIVVETAHRLIESMRSADTVARIGGDEFVMIAPALHGEREIGRVCEKIIHSVSAPMCVEGEEHFIGASIGCIEFPLHAIDQAELMQLADAAMYRAKERGGNTFEIHSALASVGKRGNLTFPLERELRGALARDQFSIEYQPQVNVVSRDIQGVEALLRWHHPQHGLIPTDQFITVAEQIGSIVPIGAWVLRNACLQLAQWDADGLPPMTMSVNISPRQLRDSGFVDLVRACLSESGIPPSRLELELVEREAMHQIEHADNKLRRLRELGVKIAIDDFGVGYSSLSRLKQLPISRIKIDRSLIADIDCNDHQRSCAISKAIITMAAALDIDLIAEGVERMQQQHLLSEQGCRIMQGYLTGKPMPAADLRRWLDAHDAQ